MKRLLLSVFLISVIGMLSAQSKWEMKMERRATFYAEEAAKEFGLNKKAKKEVARVKLAQMQANQAINKRKKNGEFENEEELKKARWQAMKPHVEELCDIMGIERKEFAAFNKRTNPMMQEVD